MSLPVSASASIAASPSSQLRPPPPPPLCDWGVGWGGLNSCSGLLPAQVEPDSRTLQLKQQKPAAIFYFTEFNIPTRGGPCSEAFSWAPAACCHDNSIILSPIQSFDLVVGTSLLVVRGVWKPE